MNYKNILVDLAKIEFNLEIQIYSMLCICLGNPPKKFDWQIRDKKNKFIRLTNVSPIDFYKKHSNIDLKDKVCLILGGSLLNGNTILLSLN